MILNAPGRAAMLWTGGKDCALALQLVRETGLDVAALVTLAPPLALFRAHPLPVLAAQAAALGLPHRAIAIDEPYDASYRRAFQSLIAEGFTHLVTGDIDRVASMPNWVRQCAQGLDIEVLTPLWCRDREELLAEVRGRGFRVTQARGSWAAATRRARRDRRDTARAPRPASAGEPGVPGLSRGSGATSPCCAAPCGAAPSAPR